MMINTYSTSSAFPPTVPPRLSKLDPAASASTRGPRRVWLWVLLVTVLVLYLLLSVGGFLYLYTDRMIPQRTAVVNPGGKTSALSSSERRSAKASHTTMASMTVKRPSPKTDKTQMGYLQWNMDHSILRNMGYYHASWVRVKEPGDYYVYARVSFSGGGGGGGRGGRAAQPGRPLVSVVKLRHDEQGKIEDAMKAYCTLGNHRNAGLCTTSQGQLLQLKAGYLLSVWVENTTWVDYEKGATTFGMYKL